MRGHVALGPDEIHLWRASLDVSRPGLERLAQTIDDGEVGRAARFRFPRDRERFVARRGLLRAILSLYTGVMPAQLRFSYSPLGKPELITGETETQVHFNVSHSRGLALYAVATLGEVGVDLERHNPDILGDGIAERFFARGEVSTLNSLPVDARLNAFFACWTRKEAYIKARGEGLSIDLNSFEVSLAPGQPAALLRTAGGPDETSRWTMLDIAPGPGYSGALCAEGHGWTINTRQWEDSG